MESNHPRETWQPTEAQRYRARRIAKWHLTLSPWAWVHAIRFREWLVLNPITVRGTRHDTRDVLLVEFWNADTFPDWQNCWVRDGFPDHIEVFVDPQRWTVFKVHREW
jgi:hypothetical protein